MPLADYLAHGNRERFLVLQIESPEALAHVDEIAAVEGFDILLFGPSDFAPHSRPKATSCSTSAPM